MKTTLIAVFATLMLSASAYAGADPLITGLQNITAQTLPAQNISKQIVKASHPSGLIEVTVVVESILNTQSDKKPVALAKLAETQRRMEAAGVFVLGTIDSYNDVHVYYIAKKLLEPNLPAEEYENVKKFTVQTAETPEIIKQKIIDAEANLAKAGMSLLSDSEWSDYNQPNDRMIDITYLRK